MRLCLLLFLPVEADETRVSDHSVRDTEQDGHAEIEAEAVERVSPLRRRGLHVVYVAKRKHLARVEGFGRPAGLIKARHNRYDYQKEQKDFFQHTHRLQKE